MYHIISYRRP